MKFKSILIASGICVLMFGVGFGVTTVVRGIYGNTAGGDAFSESGRTDGVYAGMDIPKVSSVSEPTMKTADKSLEKDSLHKQEQEVRMPLLSIEKVEGPSFQVRSRMYYATVYVNSHYEAKDDLVYELHNDDNELISSGNSSRLEIPQSQSGVYYVTVRDIEAGDRSKPYEITGCRIQRMEKSRLERICNSGDYTTMRNMEAYELSSSLTLEFSGVSEDEDVAASIDDICTRISLGIWSSISVMDIRYDGLNRIEFVKFKVEE